MPTEIASQLNRGASDKQYPLAVQRCSVEWKYQRSECIHKFGQRQRRMMGRKPLARRCKNRSIRHGAGPCMVEPVKGRLVPARRAISQAGRRFDRRLWSFGGIVNLVELVVVLQMLVVIGIGREFPANSALRSAARARDEPCQILQVLRMTPAPAQASVA
jgi:hypothetical protein